MRLLWILLALVTASSGLAGCADDAAPGTGETPTAHPASTQLEEGKGAIAGLLVDDRFRPIRLTDDPTSEFQTTGFVLLQETGEQAQTTENGEFSFVDLDPGTYTLRVTAAGHEATPQTVRIEEGIFNEVSIVARRVASDDSVILTQEYSIFAFCAVNALLPLTDACNLLDLSGDSGRIFLDIDYRPFTQTLTALVTEFQANQDGDYFILMGHDLSSLGEVEYFMSEYVDGDYTRCVNLVGETYEPCLDTNLGDPFHVNETLEYLLYINGMLDNEINDILLGLPLTGIGASLAVKGRFMLSAFLGEPEVDLETYCLLCADAA